MIELHYDPPPRMVDLVGIRIGDVDEKNYLMLEELQNKVVLKIKCEDGVFILILDEWIIRASHAK